MLQTLLTGNAPSDAVTWVPASILAWALGIAVSVIGAVVSIVVALFKREVNKMDKLLERYDQRLIALERLSADSASRPMLSSFGDRFELHLSKLSDRIHSIDKSLGERCAKLEGSIHE